MYFIWLIFLRAVIITGGMVWRRRNKTLLVFGNVGGGGSKDVSFVIFLLLTY